MSHNSNNNSFVYYQDKDFYYFRKPADISSTWGKSVCFLDLLIDEQNDGNIKNIVDSQNAFFGREKELGLLNRLDSATTGLLYFAKNPKIYSRFREMQQQNKIDKYYVAVVYGQISSRIVQNGNIINYPIMHHKFSDDRMIVIKKQGDEKLGKGKPHLVCTEICECEYNKHDNISIILVKIHKGIRHQIRIHLSSIGFPICGDELYCKSKNQIFEKLQLFSVGMEIVK